MLVAHLARSRYCYSRIQINIKGSVDSLFPLAPRQQEHAAGGAGVLVVEEVGGVDPCNKGTVKVMVILVGGTNVSLHSNACV